MFKRKIYDRIPLSFAMVLAASVSQAVSWGTNATVPRFSPSVIDSSSERTAKDGCMVSRLLFSRFSRVGQKGGRGGNEVGASRLMMQRLTPQ